MHTYLAMSRVSSYECIIRDKVRHPRSTLYVPQACESIRHFPIFTQQSTSVALMPASPLENAARSIINSTVPDFIIQNLQILPLAGHHRIIDAEGSDGGKLQVHLPPATNMRLLRSERSSLRSEAAVLSWLAVRTHASTACTKPRPRTSTLRNYHPSAQMTPTSGPSSSRRREEPTAITSKPEDFLPELLEHGSLILWQDQAIQYNIIKPALGTTISILSEPLSTTERSSVAYQVGQLIRRLSFHISPSRMFGPAKDVLDIAATKPLATWSPRQHPHKSNGSTGFTCWSDAFFALLEGALRDAEDRCVMIGYASIRHQTERFHRMLNTVSTPRLVTLDAARDQNLMVRRLPKSGCGPDKGIDRSKKRHVPPTRPDIQVTGLQNWSNCIFGDPLLTEVFCLDSGVDLWQGFEMHSEVVTPLATIDLDEAGRYKERAVHVRLLLYECYHCVTAIAREFLRREAGREERELAARRRLVRALSKLEELDDLGLPRHPRPGGERSPAKRLKSESGPISSR